ncbi:conserved hypothetical protein [Theileria orientalis strain Shintoku]|uniref:Uncharacterized protein n=1 Tax=Theileria orientalis strain Shintoku TaxID=869250 RepID=J4C9C4_THEOR|nr:conserved hypothetical protein [Theileria orientalis strain Shintoku]PVC53120.1 hypothetical protein MACL_00000298 [Theileria orientalis]BAM42293.1 conserved hypothetical protein [Theileria orientalis strain Shintoku]|eukprot:XP_009692594.1 conserved hypothetical protein [Theileria orientalis strain Shintoku]
MSKGLRSKALRRYRTAKRHVIEEVLELPRTIESYRKMKMIQRGHDIKPVRKLNKFLYPEEENAEFPQSVPKPPLDLRSERVPLSGLAGPRGRRKFDAQELAESRIVLKADRNTRQLARSFMDVEDGQFAVQSTARVGHYKAGRAKKYAANKLSKIAAARTATKSKRDAAAAPKGKAKRR